MNMNLTPAERREVLKERDFKARVRANTLAARKEEKARKKAAAAKNAELAAKRLNVAKTEHEAEVKRQYRGYLAQLRSETIHRLDGLVNALKGISATASADTAQDVEALLLRAGVNPRATFKAPEFVPPAASIQPVFVSIDQASGRDYSTIAAPRQAGKSAARMVIDSFGAAKPSWME